MYHPQKKPVNKILWSIVGGILFLHVVALLIFGGITLYEAIRPQDPTFDEPPPAEKIERVRLEYKVRMQEKQQQSARPKQKLQVETPDNMDMPDVDIQVPDLNNTGNIGRFGDGRFGGLGDGGGLGIGEISIELFDLESKGEKFLFAIDVTKSLMVDRRGGLPAYRVIKEEVIEQVESLPSGVLFNGVLFDEVKMEIWRPQLVPATDQNKEDFISWLRPVNSSPSNVGARRNNYRPDAWNSLPLAKRMRASPWGANEKLLVTLGLLEQKADSVYVFTSGLPYFESARYRTQEDIQDTREDFQERIERLGFDSRSAYNKARVKTERKVRELIREFKRKENQERAKKGIPPRIYSDRENWRLRKRMEKKLRNEDFFVPRVSERTQYTRPGEREVEDMYERQLRLLYDQRNDERPQFSVIIFKGEDEQWTDRQDDAVDDFVDFFDGDYNVVRGLGSIQTEAFQDDGEGETNGPDDQGEDEVDDGSD